MRRVPEAVVRPGRCAVFPQIGGAHEKGYFDTGSEMPGFDNHVYVSVVAVEEMARILGWTPPDDRMELEARAAGLAAEVERLTEELAEADKFAHAVDVLESRDFRARRKPGRPKQTKEAA